MKESTVPLITVEVVVAWPGIQFLQNYTVMPNTSVKALLTHLMEQLLLPQAVLENKIATLVIGIFGEKISDDYLLKHGDRLELYYPPLLDPKNMRRERVRRAKKHKK